MDNFASVEGKVALVTGAASGIGLACAEILASGGAAVMLTDIDFSACHVSTEKLAAKGYKVACMQQDVAEEQRWDEVVDACIEQLGSLEILVNNAAIYVGGLLVNNTLADVQRVHKVNVESVFLGMRAAARVMAPGGKAGNGGSIINLSSAAAMMGVPGHSAYGATKGAVRLYTKHAAVEFGAMCPGVRVNSVHPGVIATQMGAQVFNDLMEIGLVSTEEEAQAVIRSLTPLQREGTIEEVANVVRFLASDAASYVHGAEYTVDGGATAA